MSVITIYGRPKVGKTTLALKDAPRGKTAVFSADQGLLGIDIKGFTILEDLSGKALNKTVNSSFLAKHQRFVVDTATSLHQLFQQEAAGGPGNQVRKQDFGTANNHLATLLRTLKDEGKDVIVLAQERLILPNEDWVSEDDDEDTGVMTTVDLSQGAASAVLQMSDAIGRLYIAHVNDKPVRRLWLGPSSSIVAGARSDKYHGTPPYLKQPSIGRLKDLLGWTR
jgi:hypothetical protein